MKRLFFACFVVLIAIAAQAQEKPNIVFILADDLGVNDLGCYGRTEHHTPKLDQLAAEGIRFTSAYCAQPICSPTRAALMTGKSPARLQLTTFLPGRADAPSQKLLHPKIRQQLSLDETTIAELLKGAGYATACIGKWHLGGGWYGPEKQGFDVVFAGRANTSPTADEGGKGEYGLTVRAEQFIEENKERPFFLYLAHNTPHIPLAAKRELIQRNGDAFNPLYAAVIESLDDCVGRLTAKLGELGLAEKTLVVFTSDNGGLHVLEGAQTPATHNAPFRAGKGYLYEGGLRIPLIVRWPGRIKPAVSAVPVISTDWPPTLLALAGIEPPANLDGISLAPLLTGGGSLPARPLFWHFPHYTNQGGRPAGAVRESDWKLVEHYEDGRMELFDLARDPAEQTDLSMKEPKRVADLRGKLAAWRQSVGAQENSANPRFDPALHRKLYVDIDTSRIEFPRTADELAAKLGAWRATMNAVVKANAPGGVGPVVVLHARDAQVHGSSARYEPQPHKDTIGFWTKPEDWVSWTFELEKPGSFTVEMLQGCVAGGSEVEVSAGGQSLAMTVQATGHFQNFVPVKIGTLKLAAGQHTFTVKPKSRRGAAVMDLRQVVLTPAGE